ncbi:MULTISPECIES: heavy metal-responsive transcriptional regulator [Cryobacterium]|uniref:Heavy metal-responsive transcriptional regulator n=1 Tax=Cryobacterium levicorallinum TaxID=995038 RepID=A0A4R8VKM9_9MICO|nr:MULTISPECIES: heavy metal-responsive transcriptional regulator [Cryobacterium]TFB82851.1 heavy metal-responsive transcriptional regulator [Cryobacterium levicorallinum]TFD64049.1 heavy metal-responsive transcriptional regulator [Cryobacterium sp. Hh38]
MQIRDLAIASGATAQTIRFYERRGLLDPAERAGNGYRRYNEAALSRLQFIRSAKTAGLTLSEIGSIITVREAGEVPCGHVLDLLAGKLSNVHRRQQELVLLETELQHLIDGTQHLDPGDCEAGSVCHLFTQAHH